jgi:hypothetical protein
VKHDFVKSLDSYRARQRQFRVLDVPPMQYLMIDGHGDPNTAPAFSDAVATLYPVAYKLKFLSKAAGNDYVVTPLEGLWWSDDHAVFTSARDKSFWDWTLMMMVPSWITVDLVESARAAAGGAPSLELLRFETLDESRCIQTLHVGSYDDEAEVLARMHDEFIPGEGLRMVGKHHEVYLSDARRTEPAKLRTILRQPVA